MDEVKKIRNREEIPAEDKWAIEDLYATAELWEQDLTTVSEDQEYLASFAGKLATPENLYFYLQRSEELNVKADRLGNYCMRKADEDTRNATYQAMQGKFMSVFVALGAATSFDTPEIMAISDEDMERFYTDYPALERYRRYLTNLRRRKDHTLSAAREDSGCGRGDGRCPRYDLRCLCGCRYHLCRCGGCKWRKAPADSGNLRAAGRKHGPHFKKECL